MDDELDQSQVNQDAAVTEEDTANRARGIHFYTHPVNRESVPQSYPYKHPSPMPAAGLRIAHPSALPRFGDPTLDISTAIDI
jgi:hypothetical protein